MDYIERHEFEQYSQRMQDEHKRQNHRIDEIDEICKQNAKLLSSIEKLTLSIENMQKELAEQSGRLKTLESRDGEQWRKYTGYIVTSIISVIVGYLLKQIGIF